MGASVRHPAEYLADHPQPQVYVPQPGDIAVCWVPSRAAPLIRLGQLLNGDGHSRHVHAFVYIGEGFLVEAAPGGARQVQLSDTGYTDIVWSYPRFTPDEATRDRIVRAAHNCVGTPYSALDYQALAAHRLHVPDLRVWPEKEPSPHRVTLREYIDSSRHMICSQLADRCAWEAGEYLFTDGRWPGYVTPAALYNLFSEEPT